MNKPLSGIVLVGIGILLFIVGGQFYGDIGWLGFFCFVGGVIKLAFPRQLEKVNKFLNYKGNLIAYILLFVALIVVAIHLFQ